MGNTVWKTLQRGAFFPFFFLYLSHSPWIFYCAKLKFNSPAGYLAFMHKCCLSETDWIWIHNEVHTYVFVLQPWHHFSSWAISPLWYISTLSSGGRQVARSRRHDDKYLNMSRSHFELLLIGTVQRIKWMGLINKETDLNLMCWRINAMRWLCNDVINSIYIHFTLLQQY